MSGKLIIGRPTLAMPPIAAVPYTGENAVLRLFRFNYGDANPKNLINLPAGKNILRCEVVIEDAFNGNNPRLSVGTNANNEAIVVSSKILPSETGFYSFVSSFNQLTETSVLLFIFPNEGATEGSGIISLLIER